MNPSKARGIDGMPAMFFQKCWHVVRDDLVVACLNALNGQCNVRLVNKNFIPLIPKNDMPKRMIDFRPIRICSVVYKIVSKCLANRMKSSLVVLI